MVLSDEILVFSNIMEKMYSVFKRNPLPGVRLRGVLLKPIAKAGI